MRFNVYSFPRSGTHYLTALLDLNFNRGLDHSVHKMSHRIGFVSASADKRFYIHRNFEDVSRSIFQLRARFGLAVDTYEQLLAAKLSDVFNPQLKSQVTVTYLSREEVISGTPSKLLNVPFTLQEYHERHVESWRKVLGVYWVAYEMLTGSKFCFTKTMAGIADFLGQKSGRFKSIDQKVGYAAKL